ncbi:hypothetical protein BDW74DRAFT_158699 [Aspergillus multicolor]|uniref:uncharacterized protein n=1 Tax=Aspergillus multicolor TaxID=41759 RepID=UPI003CCCEBF1
MPRGTRSLIVCWKPGSAELPTGFSNLTERTWVNTSAFSFFSLPGYWVFANYLAREGNMTISFGKHPGWKVWDVPSRHDPPVGQILNIDLEKVMGRITTSFTRAALAMSNQTYYGTVYVGEVYVVVHWMWILLPAALVLLTLCFLAITILANRRQRLRLWKTSILAVPFHGLINFEDGDDDAKYDTAVQMERAAEGMQVRLKRGEDPRRLVLDRS